MTEITLKQSTIPAFKDFQLLDSNIRTTVIDGNIFFRAVDVCKAFKLGDVKDEVNKLRLRIAMTNQAVENMQDDVGGNFPPHLSADGWVKKILECTGGRATATETNYVNEPAMYYLASRGKSEACLVFSLWLFSEVIPSIRKDGFYVNSACTPEQLANLARVIADMKAENERLGAKLDESTEKMSLVKYIALKHIDIKANYLSSTGRKIGKLVKELGREDEVETVLNQKYPCKCYPVDILERYFAENN